MKNAIRVLPFLLAFGVAACQVDQEAPATNGSDSASGSSDAATDQAEPAAVHRQVATSFDLPAREIVSIRLQPTASTSGRVSFSELALVTGEERTRIDLCADERLQLVRSRKLERSDDGGCVIEFGNGSGTGWIAPTGLRNLPDSEQPRRLEVVASGELQDPFQVYLDVGNGYGSRDMLQAESVPAPTGAGG